MENKIKISQLPIETTLKENTLIPIVQDNDTKVIQSKDLLKDITSDINNFKEEMREQLEIIENNHVTTEVIEKVTKEEIAKQIADGTIANLTISDNSIEGKHIQDHSITIKHLSEDLKLDTVHAGDDTPPETALLWFKPPQFEGSGNEKADFITDGLIIYIDGRFGNVDDNSIPNRGSGGGIFYHKKDTTVIDTPIICNDGWYKCASGARATNHQALNAPDIVDLSHFKSEDITIMVRCKIPQDVQNGSHESPISMGSMPGWVGYYFKPCSINNGFQVDHNPKWPSTCARNIDDLRGKDVVLTMRKSGTALDLFINSLQCGSGIHNHATIATWKTNNTLEFEIGGLGKIGSGLIYGRALSNEEIEYNVSAEEKIRGELSSITVANEISERIKNEIDKFGTFKYKNDTGAWKNLKLPASMIETNNKSDVQKELAKHDEAIKQLSVNNSNAGYIISPSGINFKLCVTDSGELYTTMMKIPKVDIIGSLSGIGKDKPVWAELRYEGETSFHKKIKAEWQGSTSISFPKKNYGIDLYELDGTTKCELSFRDWPSTDSFHLKANWIDATHARNILCARWAKQIWRSPLPNGARGFVDGFPVELYLNGEYQGIYTWNLKQNKELFKMDKKNENHLMYRADFHEGSGSFSDWSNADIQKVWKNRIPKGVTEHTKLARVIEWVATASDNDFKTNIHQYFDLQSCIDYYVMMQIMYLQDNRRKNMTMATWDGNVWYPVFYDLDTSWGLHWNGQSTFLPETPIEEDSILWEKLARNFEDQIKSRYIELRRTVFTKTNIVNQFQIFENIVGKENYVKDQTKWTGIPSKNFGIPFIENWVNTRFTYFDKKYGVTLDD